jgi:hypothetical protein
MSSSWRDREGPKGPVTLWTHSGEGWSFYDFATVKEALESDERGYSGCWHISQPVQYEIVNQTKAAA